MTPLSKRLTNYLYCLCAITLIAASVSSQSFALTFQEIEPEIKKLINDEYRELLYSQRHKWLLGKLEKTENKIHRYIYQRELFLTYHGRAEYQFAKPICLKRNKPLADDFYYREKCLEVQKTDFGELLYLSKLSDLLKDAKAANNEYEIIWLNKRLGWEHSLAGNISIALEHFNDALKYIPDQKDRLAMQIMQDIATIYIINGDKGYIRKGMAIHESLINDIEKILDVENLSEADRFRYDRTRKVSIFNLGIAKMMHTKEELEALSYFKQILFKATDEDILYYDSLVYTVYLTARYEKDLEKTKSFLAKIDRFKQLRRKTQAYLECYVSLAKYELDASESIDTCFDLEPQTSLEVKLDVLDRLINMDDEDYNIPALRAFYKLYQTDIAPENRRRITSFASHIELKRLQAENEYKDQLVADSSDLADKIATEEKLFISFIALLIILLSLLFHKIIKLKKLNLQYYEKSNMDPLTQLPNRRALENNFPRYIEELKRKLQKNPESCLACFKLDIQDRAEIIEQHGSQTADELKVKVAEYITGSLEGDAHVYDLGRQALLLFYPEVESETLDETTKNLLQKLKSSDITVSSWDTKKIIFSLGGLSIPFAGESAKQMTWERYLRFVDFALEQAKQSNRNRCVFLRSSGIDFIESTNLGRLGTNLSLALENKTIQLDCIDG